MSFVPSSPFHVFLNVLTKSLSLPVRAYSSLFDALSLLLCYLTSIYLHLASSPSKSPKMRYPISIVCLLLSLLSTVAAQAISIDQIPAYNALRECAYDCYDPGVIKHPGYYVASKLSCQPYESPGNACFCRADLQQTAVNYLSRCVSSSCSANDLDISSATQVYKDYCTSAGYSSKVANAPAQTTGGKCSITSSLFN
jgi:hypothetical protein